MARTGGGQRTLLGVKGSATVFGFVSGAATAPAADSIRIYIDLADGQEHRWLEVRNKVLQLMDRAREDNYGRPVATTRYYRTPLDGGKDAIESTTNPLLIVSGDVAIGINTSLISANYGSLLFDSGFKQLFEFLQEWDL